MEEERKVEEGSKVEEEEGRGSGRKLDDDWVNFPFHKEFGVKRHRELRKRAGSSLVPRSQFEDIGFPFTDQLHAWF